MDEVHFTTRSGKQCTLGKQIDGLFQLEEAAIAKRAVIVPKSNAWCEARPAVFMLNQIGSVLLSCFRSGMFIYIKSPKKKTTSSPS